MQIQFPVCERINFSFTPSCTRKFGSSVINWLLLFQVPLRCECGISGLICHIILKCAIPVWIPRGSVMNPWYITWNNEYLELTKSAPSTIVERVAFIIELLLICNQLKRRPYAEYHSSWHKKKINTFFIMKRLNSLIYQLWNNNEF